MDFKIFVDRLIDLPWTSVLQVAAVFFVGMMAYQLYRRVLRATDKLTAQPAKARNWGALFENWQLLLLSSTAFILSCASGWTTWDGMRNFTGEPILSAMVTFGIQGVMLIVAWLIGESFATGMSQLQQDADGNSRGMRTDATFKIALALVMAGVLIGGLALLASYFRTGVDSTKIMTALGLTGGGLALIGALIVASRASTMRSYFDATRVMVRTAVLWVMFLACMATSVFFSFDSLFSTIFPKSERARATELRAQNQVAGHVADTGALITTRQLAEADALFGTDGWKSYDEQLAKLAAQAQSSQGEVERYFQAQMEERRRGIAQQQERISTAQAGQVGLANKKVSITEELSRLKAERPALAEDFAKRKGDVDERNKEFDGKRVEALAEARGVEGTGKVGEGPMFRQRKAEEAKMRDAIKIAEERMRDSQKRLQATEQRITQIERELSGIDGDIAKLKGEAQTADQRIKLAEVTKTSDEGVKIDPARMLPQFEKVRVEFRQHPKAEGLAQVQQMCTQIFTAMTNAPTTKDKVRGIDCDPKAASEAASRVFALNAGIAAFDANCNGGDKLAQNKSADALFEFARKCVQDSGLSSKDTDALRLSINTAELNRDDKANRFVATLNAFQDGNKLAYLALAIAIAIDSLVFMSGLFGANAIRSPLSDVPTTTARSARQLEAIIENALLPDKFDNAQLVLEALHPITPVGGYTGEVLVPLDHTNSRGRILKVLNAGAAIGAVVRDPNRTERYLVRPELFQFLSVVAKRAYEKDEENVRRGDLERIVTESLLPRVGEAVETVMDHLHPIDERNGFMARVNLDEIHEDHRRPVRNALNAGATLKLVQHAGKEFPSTYFIHGDMYRTLSRIRARMLMTTAQASLQIGHEPLHGGALRTAAPRIAPAPSNVPQIAMQAATAAPPPPGQRAADHRAAEQARQHAQTIVARTVIADPEPPVQNNPLLVNRKLMAEMRKGLLAKAGLASAKHNALDEISEIGTATGAVTQAYLALCESDTHLGRMAWALLSQAKAGLDAEHGRLKDQYEGRGDALYVDALDKEYGTLLELLPPMLLTYKGLYDRMVYDEIRRLDDLQGRSELAPEGEPILDRLHMHNADLEKEFRMTSASWAAVARHVKAYTEPKSVVAQAGQRKPVLN